MSYRLKRGLIALLVLGLIGSVAGAASAARSVGTRMSTLRGAPRVTPVANDDLYKAYEQGRISEGKYALDRARSLFALHQIRARYGHVTRPDGHAATVILRDLALRLSKLSGSDRAAANRLLARPTNPRPGEVDYGAATDESTCTSEFCVHWASSGVHAPDLTDSSGNGIPDWVDGVVGEYDYVVGSYLNLGYRLVKSDLASEDNGGSALPDIYLADVGAVGLYGYCASDDPNRLQIGNTYNGYDMSAYCVIDDDFAATQFPTNTPFENMQVTAAHEFFHAVQFAYDIGDDSWFMEATATWMEDVMYDDVNDNYQYLFTSPITYPDVPIDLMDEGDFFRLRYGQWIFIRFMTEYFGTGVTPDNDLVREMWERASARDGSTDLDEYSIEAIKNVIADHGSNFADVFGDFGASNWVIELFYEEGADYFDYLLSGGVDPRPYVSKAHKITRTRPKTGNWQVESAHLTTTNVTFVPKRGVKSNAKLLMKVNGPASAASPEARYVIFYRSGLPDLGILNLDGQGDGKIKVPFGKGTVSYVVLALSNASTRYTNCYSGSTRFSCLGGIPKDDGAKFIWSGTLKQ